MKRVPCLALLAVSTLVATTALAAPTQEQIDAARAGDADAQFNLGAAYDLGDGVARDPAEAARWFRQAAEQGDREAQSRLGSMLYHGDGVVRDDNAAFGWLARAAQQGDVVAQRGLAVLYYNGQGTPQHLVEALKWALLAAGQGDAQAADHRDYLRGRLAPFQVREAEALAAEWAPRSERRGE
jgi:TPR repeat protein